MKFVDRESRHPNRVRIVPEEGEPFYATLTRADNPTVPGTLLNAATFNEMIASFAPAGYGLGKAKSIAWDAIDTAYSPGWYHISGENTINGITANYWYLFVAAYGDGHTNCIQILYPATVTHSELRRKLVAGTWRDWVCENPPMSLGVEYRTPERWQNKPVYTKLIDFGAMPNSSAKEVAHGATATQIVRCRGQISDGRTIPYGGTHIYNVDVFANLTNVIIDTNSSYSQYTATVQIWYTKS